MEELYKDAVALLQQLIALPSFSKEEERTAALLQQWLATAGIPVQRINNNIVARNRFFDPGKPVLLLNSHHDTVRPSKDYTRDPFVPCVEEGRLYGLGSNDAGAALVCLLMTFRHFYEQENLPYNIVWAATAEEEISGQHGITAVLPELGRIDCAVVGEPTGMQMAVAERGLLVIDGVAKGIAGHAARKTGKNAIEEAMKDIAWFHCYSFEQSSDLLGPVTMQVTVIETENKAHNVVPDSCRFTVDIRLNERYGHEEVLAIIRQHTQAAITARSTRLRSSIIPADHPLTLAGKSTGMTCYGSPTLSDKALMPFPALKLGPGDSDRSHTADEFIYLEEIRQGIEQYIALIDALQV